MSLLQVNINSNPKKFSEIDENEPTEMEMTYKEDFASAKTTSSSRILTDGDVTRVLHPDTSKKEVFDNISNPDHYTGGRKYEPRKVIADWGLNFYLGNTVKYISRAGRKGDALEDLKKAAQYLEWEIERLEENERR